MLGLILGTPTPVRTPAAPATAVGGVPHSGRVSVKVAPRPSRLATVSVPPIASASLRETVRPSPVPSMPARAASRRSKGVNSFARSWLAIPGPVSSTEIATVPAPVRRAPTVTSPSGESKVTAFDSRFMTTWRSRVASARTYQSSALPSRSCRVTPRACASGSVSSSASRTAAPTDTGARRQ